MNLSKLFEAQRKLDERIVKEKGLEGQDLLDKKILALQVELGELANEWRGFKFWSEDQKPNKFTANPDDVCEVCKGEPIHFNEDKTKIIGQCKNCDGVGVHFHNPLLEEYVDCLHFILSIGNELDIEQWDYGYDFTEYEINQGNVTEQFILLIGMVSTLHTNVLQEDIHKDNPEVSQLELEMNTWRNYRFLIASFLLLGEMLSFTPEQIEQAYFDKNKINHERQESGY